MTAEPLCARLPWLVAQTEAELLFLSWPIAPTEIAGRIPVPLRLDLHEGEAWITLIPFRMERLHLRWLPPVPPFSRFAEVDCLTYVRLGGEAGIWFFRIDAGTLLGSVMGRALFALPYHHSRVRLVAADEWRVFHALGAPSGAGVRPELRVRYRPTGPEFEAAPGTLAHFIVERFVMYSRTGGAGGTGGTGGTLLRGREARAPRRIRDCEVRVEANTLPAAAGVPGPDGPLTAWICARSAIRTWLPAPVAATTPAR